MKDILIRNKLDETEILPDNWYPVKPVLQVFAEVEKKLGLHTLFAIGKAVPEFAEFPAVINDIKSALFSIGIGYESHHRNGEIGTFKVLIFSEEGRFAEIESSSIYHSESDRGTILGVCRKFQPRGVFVEVKLDIEKPTRTNGAKSCVYCMNLPTN